MSNTPQGMLPGDEFSLPDWVAAQSSTTTMPVLPVEVVEAVDDLLNLCKEHGIPIVVAAAASIGVQVYSELGSEPSIVPAELLMSRAMVSGNPEHVMQVAMAQMQGMKL